MNVNLKNLINKDFTRIGRGFYSFKKGKKRSLLSVKDFELVKKELLEFEKMGIL